MKHALLLVILSPYSDFLSFFAAKIAKQKEQRQLLYGVDQEFYIVEYSLEYGFLK